MAVYPQTVDSLNDLFNEAKTEKTYGSVNSTRAHPPREHFYFQNKMLQMPHGGASTSYTNPHGGVSGRGQIPDPWDN